MTSEKPRPSERTGRPPHSRIADDEPHIGKIIQMKLELGSYEVILVPDGQAALDHLESDEPIDLVLLDIMMPFVSGLDVLARMRELPHRRNTPVFMLTAKGQDENFVRQVFSPSFIVWLNDSSPKEFAFELADGHLVASVPGYRDTTDGFDEMTGAGTVVATRLRDESAE